MKLRRKLTFVVCAMMSLCSINAQQLNQAYLNYIEQYYKIAQQQQHEYGIPSSITLAQGLLESSAGNSFLSKTSNNHFGIKCSDWSGEKVYYDDDAKGECFRKYQTVLESYEDHSKFLKSRSRYAFLFQLKQTDYEGWAFGLKSAGYATDPTYAYKLISIIENYNLKRFDNKGGKFENDNETGNLAVEIVAKNDPDYLGKVSAVANRELKKVNGVLFVIAQDGDTYASIGDEFDLSDERIRRYNDVTSSARLVAGQRVFIELKKRKAPKGYETHKVTDGESMWKIAQDYGVRVICLYKINKMSYEQGARFGQILNLR